MVKSGQKRGSNKGPRKPRGQAPQKTNRKEGRGFRPLAGGLSGRDERKPAAAPENHKPAPAPSPTHVRRELKEGPQPIMVAPTMLTLPSFPDYELIDSGFGEKLERYGPYKIIRPEGQALWQPRLSQDIWDSADAVFTGNDDEDAVGRWRFQNALDAGSLEDAWALSFHDVQFHARFTAFRHMGFFPEQAAHWAWFHGLIKTAGRPVNVLNLFGYTGVASLVAAEAGAHVTHVDASKKAIGWARDNQQMSDLADKPIRWICDDAVRFVEREIRRGKTYDAVIMDPPKYGRGPKGEVWQFFEGLSDLMHNCRTLLSDDPLFFILSSYAIRASFMASHELARDTFSGLGGQVESGELLIQESGGERAISTSLFTRWSAQNG